MSVPELLFPKKVIPWTPFTEQRLLELVKEGKPVLIDFTADWCFNCRVNEKVAIEKPAVLGGRQEATASSRSTPTGRTIPPRSTSGSASSAATAFRSPSSFAPGDLEQRVAIDGLVH